MRTNSLTCLGQRRLLSLPPEFNILSREQFTAVHSVLLADHESYKYHRSTLAETFCGDYLRRLSESSYECCFNRSKMGQHASNSQVEYEY